MDGMYAGFAGAKTGHGHITLNWRFLVPPFRQPGFATLAPLRRRHQRTVLAVRGEYAVKTCQIDSGFGHQGGQLGNEIHRLDKIAGSDFEQPKAGPKGGGQDARSNITWVVPSRYGVFSSYRTLP
jgi:hypothetical protein